MNRRTFKVSTADVFKAIESERDYQESRWNASTTPTEGKHTISEFIAYMEDYLAEAKHTLTRKSDTEANPIALDIIRKVTTLGVACMEQNGAPQRKGFER